MTEEIRALGSTPGLGGKHAPSPMPGRVLRWAAGVLILSAVYFGAAWLGLESPSIAEQVSAVWPPTGIALAALLLFGFRFWPGIALGAFLANFLHHESWAMACGIATGNTLEALLGAWLLRHVVRFDTALERIKDILGLIVLAAGFSTTVSATIGVTVLSLGRVYLPGLHRIIEWTDFGALWWIWWLGDAMGALVVAPVLLVWASGRSLWRPRRPVEALALLSGLLATSLVVFATPLTVGHGHTSLAYIIFPFVIWAALRFGQRGTTAVTVIASGVAICGSIYRLGPFGAESTGESLFLLQAFMAVVAITALLLGAALSERGRAEAELRKGDKRLRLALEAGRMGAWEWNPQTNELSCSPTLEAMHGLESGALAGTWEPYLRSIHPQDRDLVARSIKEAVAQPGEHRIEYRVVWPDQSVHWVERRGEVFRDHSGRPNRMSGVCVDITARKRAEETFKFLAEASAALASLVDYESTLHKVCRLAVPFFGDWCAVDVVQEGGALRHLAAVHANPDKVALIEELYRRYPPDPDQPRGPSHVIRTGKSEIVAEVTEALLGEMARDADHLRLLRLVGPKSYLCVPLALRGKLLGAVTFATTETNRRYGPEDLTIAEELVHRVSVAIDNAKLYDEVREADRRKDEFLAMLAHELRNPLAPIRTGLDLLEMEGVDEKTVKWVHATMREQVIHMVRLVDDLLDVSRIMRGKIQLRKERLELSSVVACAVAEARPLVDALQHQLTVALPSAAVWLDADPVRLAQVIANLLNNAAKYSEKGGQIWLRAERRGNELVLQVKDTGIGLTPEMQQHVFDLFAQADHSIERTQGGLGIGLTLVRSLVEMHGGRVEVFSEGPGRGSQFTVRLPALPERPATDGETPPPVPESREAIAPRRVLVVDDNAEAALLLAEVLRNSGHTVRVEHDGPSAIHTFQTFLPEVVLLDIGLPGMDGYDVARELRRQPSGRDVLLLALTGYGQREDRRRSEEAGFDVHLVKPVSQQEIAAAMAHSRPAAGQP